jgi:hypothetical protein
MGRSKKPIDTELMLSLLTDGMSRGDTAAALGITPPTLDARIADLQREESALLAYDKCHYLDLIGVQQRLVAGVTDAKIEEAPLGQIAQAYGVFNRGSQLAQGRPTEIHGLMGYLMHLEKEDIEEAMSKSNSADALTTPAEDAEFAEPEQMELFG